MVALADLFDRWQYQPNNQGLFTRALTHSSFSQDNNERLEFLGDALLEVCIADLLYTHFPGHDEGSLTRFRAELVRKETLADIAREFSLEKYIRCSEGVRKSGALAKDGILSGALEAVVAACYLDSNFDTCRQLVCHWFSGRLDTLESRAVARDAKSRLQEYLQAQAQPLACYEVVRISGMDHQQVFTVLCKVEGRQSVEAEGASKKMAEQQAARRMLEQLGVIEAS